MRFSGSTRKKFWFDKLALCRYSWLRGWAGWTYRSWEGLIPQLAVGCDCRRYDSFVTILEKRTLNKCL